MVKETIDGDVGQGESIQDVQLKESNLIVYVDLSDAIIPDGFSKNDVAVNRFSSITNHILKLDGCDDLWEAIIVDFENIGYITGGKADITNGECGRSFREEAIKIQKDVVAQLISKTLVDFYREEEILSVSVTGDKAEAKILTDFVGEYWSEEWGEICDKVMSVSAALREAVPEDNVKYIIVYLANPDDDIFLTISNGKTMYNKYEKPEPTPEPTSEPTPASTVQTSRGSSGIWGSSSTTNEITGGLGQTAYWTSGGKSYHFSAGCPSLSRSANIKTGTLQDALNAGKTDPCNNCANGS